MLDFARPETLPGRRDEAWRYSDMRAAMRAPLPPASANYAPGEPDWIELVWDEPNGGWSQITDGAGSYKQGAISGLHTLRFHSASSHAAHHGRYTLRVTEGGSATLFEPHQHTGRGYASEIELHIKVRTGGRLERIVLLDDAEDAVSLVRAHVELSPGAVFQQTVLASGAKLQRSETHVIHPGSGALVRLDGVYVLDGARHADLTSVVTHTGVDGVTTELTKGVVRDRARGVFQGKIVVAEGADRTDARMGHHALLLSDRAEVDAKPELEIFADDVSCAHGNTVGALDEEALFYARSRGIPEAEARAMLIEAFLGEVIDRIEHEGAREACRGWLAGKLRGDHV